MSPTPAARGWPPVAPVTVEADPGDVAGIVAAVGELVPEAALPAAGVEDGPPQLGHDHVVDVLGRPPGGPAAGVVVVVRRERHHRTRMPHARVAPHALVAVPPTAAGLALGRLECQARHDTAH